MKQDIIEKLVRPMIREITPYRSARDEFEDFDAQKIFLDANENPFDNKIIIFDEVHNFIVTIANIYKKMQKSTDIQQMKKNVYNDLKNAINCKIILCRQMALRW